MTVLAVASSQGPGGVFVAGGALAFAVSDVAVALDRWMGAVFPHRLWGLPLYYAAQLSFAWSVGC